MDKNGDFVIAFAGNPNVGKSTVFNELTGLRQHTGNWAGKTVSNACGFCRFENREYILADLPGCYSLYAHSAEEELARDFILFGNPDAVCVVCDATCLERNMNLVLQTLEISKNVVVCVNMMDEAQRGGIRINLRLLSKRLGVPVVGTTARSGKNVTDILRAASAYKEKKERFKIEYDDKIKTALDIICPTLCAFEDKLSTTWLALALLQNDRSLILAVSDYLCYDIMRDEKITAAVAMAKDSFDDTFIPEDSVVSSIIIMGEKIAREVVIAEKSEKHLFTDKLLTSRLFGYPIMLLLLALIFWITLCGANYPSSLLSKYLFAFQDIMLGWCDTLGITCFFTDMLILGMYRVLAWVVAVMLPPAIVKDYLKKSSKFQTISI